MHHPEMRPASRAVINQLDFLWLELTNQCNLQCIHCYAESGPRAGGHDVLETQDYIRLLDEAHALGCRSVQFIGGEPTLNRDLANLIVHASKRNFELIEVFTNLTRLTEPLAALFKTRRVHVATSVYADTADIHDKITAAPGSFARTTGNIKKLIAADIPVRVGVIAMDENRHVLQATIAFLQSIGVQSIGADGLRKIGRGALAGESAMSELCGQCAGPKLCVGPDGGVSPCIMSKAWPVGSVLQASLSDIVQSVTLSAVRHEIAQATRPGTNVTTACNPDRSNPCNPDYGGSCNPCNPNTRCGPNDCQPQRIEAGTLAETMAV